MTNYLSHLNPQNFDNKSVIYHFVMFLHNLPAQILYIFCLLPLPFALHYISQMLIRKIIFTDKLLIDVNVFPLKNHRYNRIDIKSVKKVIYEKDKNKSGIPKVTGILNHISTIWYSMEPVLDDVMTLPYAIRQHIILYNKNAEELGQIDLYGFYNEDIDKIMTILNLKN